MKRPDPASTNAFERKSFILLLVVLTVAFAWIVWPFYGAVFWGAVLAMLFEPLYRKLAARLGNRRSVAALMTLLVIVLMVILPLALVAVSLVQEVSGLYQRVKSGQVDFGAYFAQMVAALPSWATGLLERLGLTDLAVLQAKLTAAITQRGQTITGRAVDFGQDALDLVVGFFIAMYLLFFLLRDGASVAREIRAAIPLEPPIKARLLERFTTVIRATVKGNVLVAAAQGALGGLAFWVLGVHAPMLWAVVMAFLSLLPAVGAALIWAPVALYLLATGQVWQGFGLIAFGVFVIGLIDNVLRPILVGKDTQLPDYVVLISTVGGLALIGINGFVIGPLIAAMFVVGVAAAHRRACRPATSRRSVDVSILPPCRSAPTRSGSVLRRPCARAGSRGAIAASPRLVDAMEDASERIRELEARLVAHGLVLKTIARLLSHSTVAELKAAAQGIDDEGMQEANPNLHMRRVAEEIWSILEMVG